MNEEAWHGACALLYQTTALHNHDHHTKMRNTIVAAASPETLFEEISEYFVSRMTPEEIIALTPSQALDESLHELLDRNSENTLTHDERIELDRFLQMNHLLTILKAKARLKLAGEE